MGETKIPAGPYRGKSTTFVTSSSLPLSALESPRLHSWKAFPCDHYKYTSARVGLPEELLSMDTVLRACGP